MFDPPKVSVTRRRRGAAANFHVPLFQAVFPALFPVFLTLSGLCSLLDDISGTLPPSVLVAPMGSSLQSFPLPPPPPPHAPGQLGFGSSWNLLFPPGISTFWCFFLGGGGDGFSCSAPRFFLPLLQSWRVLALLSRGFAKGSCAFPSVFPGSSQVYPIGDAREEQRERNSSPTRNPRAFLRLPPSASAFLQPHRAFPAPFLEFLSFPPAPYFLQDYSLSPFPPHSYL